MGDSDKNGTHSQDTNCNANIIYTEWGATPFKETKNGNNCSKWAPTKEATNTSYSWQKQKKSNFFALANSNVTKSTDMVKNGFLYTGFADMTVCYNCGATIKTWEDGEIIEETHLKNNRNCKIAKQHIQTLKKGAVASKHSATSVPVQKTSQTDSTEITMNANKRSVFLFMSELPTIDKTKNSCK